MLCFVPKPLFESEKRLLEKMLPFGRETLGDGKCIDPQRLDLDRFADARGNNFAINLRIHPGELNAGNAGRNQPVIVDPNVKTSSGLITE